MNQFTRPTRRAFMEMLAGALAPISPLSSDKVQDILSTAETLGKINDLSVEQILRANGWFDVVKEPIDVDEHFTPEKFSNRIGYWGVDALDNSRLMDELQITPEILYEHKDVLMERTTPTPTKALSPESQQIHDALRFYDKMSYEALKVFFGQTYGQIADKIEARVGDYITSVLERDGGEQVLIEGAELLNPHELEVFKERYGHLLPEDVVRKIDQRTSGWQLEELGGSSIHYFRIRLAEGTEQSQQAQLHEDAFNTLKRKLERPWVCNSSDALEKVRVGNETWIHAKTEKAAEALEEECVENTVERSV